MEKKFVYAKAANGMTVRIPEDCLEEWGKRQEELKAGTAQIDPETAERLRLLMEKK
ncbi:MAG: hypothetical protein FWG32_09880 [Oscillospiraceae bacterium]|nr:hypothetical protein [Oscillospiraceae bacterium]